eukprot:GHVN01008061.1.p1 GENE.GHVN01008061.1~~GHVN01008061.1.p1  ORF type:complete len:208 (+),score=4.65 GHVN01008061.1:36-626(+)
MTHRTSYHSSIGDSPFYVLYGRDPILPQEVELKSTDMNIQPANIRDRMAVFNRLRKSVSYYQRREQNIAAEKYDRKHTEVQDLVLHLTRPHERKTKLTWKWSPPQRILEKLPNGVTFKIQCTETGKESIWHCQNLTPFTRQTSEITLKEELVFQKFSPTAPLSEAKEENYPNSPASSASSISEEGSPISYGTEEET